MSAPATDRLPAPVLRLLAGTSARVVVHDLYDDVGAEVYAAIVRADHVEVREVLRAVARTTGPVLELAAGEGRLTLPLLALGRSVTAVDLSAAMLARLEKRLDDAPRSFRDRLRMVRADMSEIALDELFGAVVLGTTSVTLLDPAARRRLYDRIRQHLAPGGQVVVSVAEDTGEDAPEEAADPVWTEEGRGFLLTEHRPRGAGYRDVAVLPLPLEAGEDGVVDVCTSRVRLLTRSELLEETTQAGFELVDVEPVATSGTRFGTVLVTLR
ncbi:methylation protein MtfA [Georgenia satyanarayanai]|uniref:Methylation protein MtfA n=1 Tax=Georgenia satyanarayanai TaxID=860221 RepID=A0A2Y9AKC4_9MICO|nr:daptide-type RiPP biosynthesis methyltransferase [Georgenia satyanarayanai]PYF98932.1 methylation protein MtfA [Georgenia satyanarayanai]SSA44780.1 methylation protein MtfA [Georgenia satyanarayanai]